MSATAGKKAVVAALFANLGIAVAKLVAFAVTRSSSMLAESVHSLADSGNQGLLLLGQSRARRVADERRPFGYGAARYFWSFVVALVLFSVGGLFAIVEGVEKLRHPHELDSPQVAIGVLLVAIVLESFSFRTAIHEARPLLAGRSWWRFVRTAKTPELPVVLLEDLAALVGLVLALAGVGLATLTDVAELDGAATIAIGVLLVVVAVILAIEMSSLLLGEAADPAEIDAIRAAVVADGAFARLIHLRTLHLGPEDLLVAGKVEPSVRLDVSLLTDAIDAAESRIRAAVPAVRVIYLEPDRFDAPPS